MDSKLKQVLAYTSWRQSIDLKNGYKTPGHVESSIWEFIGLPEQLNGKSFLDIGANDGLFSIEAERRGATEIVASDLYKDSIDTMKNGWSNEGILLLKEYLNSGIELHSKGVYHLNELGRKFDVVIMNDIINWLEDIELAFKNIAEVTRGAFYLSDGFILDNSTPKQVKPEGKTLRFMYNLKYMIALLEKNGFKVELIKELNYQKVFIKDFLSSPKLILQQNTKVYQLPDRDSTFFTTNAREAKSNREQDGFFHIHQLGWVLKKDVKAHYHRASGIYRFARIMGLQEFYFRLLQARHKKQTGITAYSIKAVKIR